MRIYTKYFLILFAFILSGCASLLGTPVMSTKLTYERDIVMDVSYVKDGKWAGPLRITGMGVMYKSSHYKVKVYPPGKADMITLASCHRTKKTPNPKKKGGWRQAGYYEFSIPVADTVDGENSCFFDVGVFEKEKGRHAWGTIAFEDPSFYKMKALTKCNGRHKQYDGVSVCQAKEGSIQQYEFDRLVAPSESPGCEIVNFDYPRPSSKVWKFIMPKGACEVEFYDIENPLTQIHRASLVGFDIIPIRGLK